MFPKRRLGRTELWVTPIGLGGAWLGRTSDGGFDDNQAFAAVDAALAQGINLIDTSPLYGESERRLGIALKEWFRRGGKREAIVISSKTGTRTRPYDYSGAATRASVEESLRLLNLDYLDICHIHDPSDLAPALAPNGALAELKKMKAEGLIRAIGLGVRDHSFHRRMMETGELEVSLTYRDYNLLYQSALDGVMIPSAERNIGVFNAMVVIGGLLGDDAAPRVAKTPSQPGETLNALRGPYQPLRGEEERAEALRNFAHERGVSLLALNLQFCARQPRVNATLLGVSSVDELNADLAALAKNIPETIWDELRRQFEIKS